MDNLLSEAKRKFYQEPNYDNALYYLNLIERYDKVPTFEKMFAKHNLEYKHKDRGAIGFKVEFVGLFNTKFHVRFVENKCLILVQVGSCFMNEYIYNINGEWAPIDYPSRVSVIKDWFEKNKELVEDYLKIMIFKSLNGKIQNILREERQIKDRKKEVCDQIFKFEESKNVKVMGYKQADVRESKDVNKIKGNVYATVFLRV